MIERLWALLQEFWSYLVANFDPLRDAVDILVVTLAVYWVLLLIRGTRAFQIVIGLMVLTAAYVSSEYFQLVTVGLILDNFLSYSPLIIVVLFQADIRRALARVGRGFFPTVAPREESQILEEVVRATQTLAQRRLGALIVLERETALNDQFEGGTAIEARVSKELLTSIFLPHSPLHDGAVVIQSGRIAYAGCILPLTMREDLPEGVGTRHRAGVGITEETDAVVVVVSEETAAISVVMSGELTAVPDTPRLRVLLREILTGERRAAPVRPDTPRPAEASEQVAAPDPARAGSAG
ncbi:MAG: diadenylate cyclase CdaA [Myxococcota bacterium]